jgi:hypothetical protein
MRNRTKEAAEYAFFLMLGAVGFLLIVALVNALR